MKVSGPTGVSSAAAPRGAARTGPAGFAMPTAPAGEAAATARAGSVSAVSSLDALMALQEVGGPLERRKRAARRAGRILDVLDDVKLALIDGSVSAHSLSELARAIREEREATDDPRLEAVLDEIETRAAVEMAKLESAGARPLAA